MADFRKWVLLLAVLALAASSASAAVSCTALSGGVSTLVRQEGIAELVGDIVLTCTGTSTTPISVNLQLFLNTNITSRAYGGSGAGNRTEALLLLGNDTAEPGAGLDPILGANVFNGRVSTLATSLIWTNIPVLTAAEPVATTRTIRITNVRANANAIPSGAGLPGTIQAFVSITGTQTITLVNPQFTVAGVLPGIRDVGTRNSDNSDSLGTKTYQQCTGLNSAFAGAPSDNKPGLTYQLRFRENFPTAFKPIGGGQTAPGVPYFTESGLTPNISFASEIGTGVINVGQASQATRLFARFANVPPGVRIFVTRQQTPNSSSSITANMVGFDPTAGGSGVATTDIPAGISVTTATSSEGFALVEVPLTGGTGSAVWEIATANATSIPGESILFGVVVAFPANLTIATSPTPLSTVAGGYAPISTNTGFSTSAPVPRFADTSSAINVFQVSLCVTNLLYPYVTNQGGFDTGIAIVNTSLDNATGSSGTPPNQPFKTTPQHGVCTVYYFGSMASGGQLPAPQTTVDIAAGQMVTFAVSQGGVPGATSSAAGFQGYLIVRCNFQFAHGFAFVSDVGANRVSHGYLALVIPDRTREASPFSSAGSGSGEQLVN